MSAISSTASVDALTAKDTMKMAPQLVSVTQSPPKPQPLKPYSLSASSSKTKPSPKQMPSQAELQNSRSDLGFLDSILPLSWVHEFDLKGLFSLLQISVPSLLSQSQELSEPLNVPGLVTQLDGSELGQRRVGCPV